MRDAKNWIIAILLVAFGISMLVHYMRKPCPQMHIPAGTVTELQQTPGGPVIVQRYTDSAGKQHTVLDRNAQQRISRGAREVAELIAPKLDSIAYGLAIKPRQVESFNEVKFSVNADSLRFYKRQVDSLKRQTFFYKDKYLQVIVRADDPEDTVDNSAFDFSYDADITSTDYFKRRKIFGFAIGPKDYFTDITSADPRVKIRGVDRFTIPRRQPPFGLRLQALTSYNVYRNDFSTGLGLRVDVGPGFNADVSYTYNFTLKRWLPAIVTRYDLIQIGR